MQPRSPLKEGTRLLDALSDSYADVHVSLLPSPILLGPNALEERRAAPDDGARGVFVTAGSLRNALRKAGVLLGDADERVVGLLLAVVLMTFLPLLLLMVGAAYRFAHVQQHCTCSRNRCRHCCVFLGPFVMELVALPHPNTSGSAALFLFHR